MILTLAKAKRPAWAKGASKRRELDDAYAIADKYFRGMKRQVLVTVKDVVSPADLKRIAAAVKNKDAVGAIRILPTYDPSDPRERNGWHDLHDSLKETYRSIITESGKKSIATLELPTRFNLDNPYSLAWVDKKAKQLTRQLATDGAKNVVGIIRSGFTDGLNIDDMAKLIRAEIGLHPKQALAVQRRAAAALERGVDPDVMARQASTYAEQLLTQRAERIARTEVIEAEAQGVMDSWAVAADDGLIPRDTEQEWIGSTRENGACPICADLDTRKVRMGQPWYSKVIGQEIKRPPAHSCCRCTVGLVIE